MRCKWLFSQQAYIEFVKSMGGLWLERNISVFLNHILDLVANPKATPTHVDAVYARKCILFIIRSAIGGLLGEKAQIAAAKEISQVIVKQMNIVGRWIYPRSACCLNGVIHLLCLMNFNLILATDKECVEYEDNFP